jgi:hypothetical protein
VSAEDCCACLGCPVCEHDCGLPNEEGEANRAHYRAVIDAVVTGLIDDKLVRVCTSCQALFDPRFVPGAEVCHSCLTVDPDYGHEVPPRAIPPHFD